MPTSSPRPAQRGAQTQTYTHALHATGPHPHLTSNRSWCHDKPQPPQHHSSHNSGPVLSSGSSPPPPAGWGTAAARSFCSRTLRSTGRGTSKADGGGAPAGRGGLRGVAHRPPSAPGAAKEGQRQRRLPCLWLWVPLVCPARRSDRVRELDRLGGEGASLHCRLPEGWLVRMPTLEAVQLRALTPPLPPHGTSRTQVSTAHPWPGVRASRSAWSSSRWVFQGSGLMGDTRGGGHLSCVRQGAGRAEADPRSSYEDDTMHYREAVGWGLGTRGCREGLVVWRRLHTTYTTCAHACRVRAMRSSRGSSYCCICLLAVWACQLAACCGACPPGPTTCTCDYCGLWLRLSLAPQEAVQRQGDALERALYTNLAVDDDAGRIVMAGFVLHTDMRWGHSEARRGTCSCQPHTA